MKLSVSDITLDKSNGEESLLAAPQGLGTTEDASDVLLSLLKCSALQP